MDGVRMAGCPDCGYELSEKRRRCYRCKPGRTKAGISRDCKTCGESFYVPQWKTRVADRNVGVFCSRKCKDSAPDWGHPVRSDGRKWCPNCENLKPREDFSSNNSAKDGKYTFCRECSRLLSAQWRTKNPERYLELNRDRKRTDAQKQYRFERDLETKYGITLAVYQQLLERQAGACAICGGPPTLSKGERYHIDHDHSCCPGVGSCGRCVRGLLCSNCNTMLGLAKDDSKRLQAAIDYLSK